MAPFPEGQIWETTDVQERGVHSAELLKTIVHQHRQLVPRLSSQTPTGHRPNRAARRRNVSKRRRSADVEKPHHAGVA